MKLRERLRFRLYAAVRDLALGTELFRVHYSLHEPEVLVSVYAQFAEVSTTLTENQLRLLPGEGRARELPRFAAELEAGFTRIAGDLGLELLPNPNALELSGRVQLAGVPIGYRAIFGRLGAE